jgi:2',3'-cyclic-nucleotide 2'-phosphodiesterase (5'-nucleotidase family)
MTKIKRNLSLNIKQFVLFVTFTVFLFSCSEKPRRLQKVEGEFVAIDTSLVAVDSLEAFVKPYRDRINTVLDSSLAVAPRSLLLDDDPLNTSLGNYMADMFFRRAQPVFKSRTGKDIDMVLLNHGGIRSIVSKGAVSRRTAYQLMPFENQMVVAELDGAAMQELLSYLSEDVRAHPIANAQIVFDKNKKPVSFIINGMPLEDSKTYFVGTSDYLLAGGDRMDFFKKAVSVTELDYLLRSAIIDDFMANDSIVSSVDDRIIKK